MSPGAGGLGARKGLSKNSPSSTWDFLALRLLRYIIPDATHIPTRRRKTKAIVVPIADLLSKKLLNENQTLLLLQYRDVPPIRALHRLGRAGGRIAERCQDGRPISISNAVCHC